MELKDTIRIIEGFPKEGISFKDITTLLANPEALRETIDRMADFLRPYEVDAIVGPEARGFLFGTCVAYALGVAFIPVRKPGKLPAETVSYEYELEYGTDRLEIHKDAIKPGMKIAIVDDLLATGGTVEATSNLIQSMGGSVEAMAFVIELTDLEGRARLEGYPIEALVSYNI